MIRENFLLHWLTMSRLYWAEVLEIQRSERVHGSETELEHLAKVQMDIWLAIEPEDRFPRISDEAPAAMDALTEAHPGLGFVRSWRLARRVLEMTHKELERRSEEPAYPHSRTPGDSEHAWASAAEIAGIADPDCVARIVSALDQAHDLATDLAIDNIQRSIASLDESVDRIDLGILLAAGMVENKPPPVE